MFRKLSDKLNPREESLPSYLIYAQSLSSIAPLGSASAYLTYALYDSYASTFLASIVGSLIYFLWVLIGYRYSKIIGTTGGIYDFAKSAKGQMVGSLAGWFYWISYAIYLPSATTYLVGIVLPSEFQLPIFYLSLIEISIPIALTLLLLTGAKPPLFYTFISTILEITLLIILGIKVLSITGISGSPFQLSVNPTNFISGSLAVGFTLAGGGASFFLGYEAKGRGKTVGKSYAIAYWIAAVAIIFASYFEIAFAGFSNQGVSSLLSITDYPGFYISQKLMGYDFSLIFFILTINSLIGSVTAAYVALSRLTFTMLNRNMILSILVIAVFFLTINLIAGTTGNYFEVYDLTTASSLISLYVSHVIVSAVYPFFAKKNYRSGLLDILLGISASFLMGYGVYSSVNMIGVYTLIAGVIMAIIHQTLLKKMNSKG
ncbi:amino acid permease [Candidatus Acidianus copahuensis]|uniref:Amino acid permease n=1 Tax=Candidatus Acidianus copahuensis TaxID=1160895 RepID=A0A031LHZ5_9CREN|nr:APC family permease [Candidatus Acidianus copahuensis]EZQ01777.1 amino acid permease [Candidatus Acidianus copahuensis]